jgi:hypothetical protein
MMRSTFGGSSPRVRPKSEAEAALPRHSSTTCLSASSVFLM